MQATWKPTIEFFENYIRSMRLYYGFVTLTAGWIGVALFPGSVSTERQFLILAIMFIGWGVNQIVNDFTGRREDAVNAPNRPMVSGKLAPFPALVLSGAVIAAALVYSAFTAPLSMVPIAAGVALNILYSLMKGYGFAGNITFGATILCCFWYGYVASGGGLFDFYRCNAAVAIAVVVINIVMTTFTYFKDVAGDRAAGKRTIVVLLGPQKASRVMLAASFLPLIIMVALIPLAVAPITYMIPVTFSGLLYIKSGFRFAKNFSGAAAYHQLGMVFAATAASQAALVALAMPFTGTVLSFVSALLVLVIFNKGYGHADE